MRLVIGSVVRAHGVRGEVVVYLRTDEPAQRFVVGATLDTLDRGELVIAELRPHQGRLLIRFEGVADRNAAEALRGVEFFIDSAEVADPADPDEFNDFQLVGLRAVGVDGVELGHVVRVDHAPSSELLVLRLTDARLVMVPFVKAIVPEVDLAGGRVVLDPPEGLLEL